MARCRFATASQLVAHVEKLASLPSTLQEVMAVLGSRRFSVRGVSEVIQKDPPLAARLLRLANSGFFARRVKVTTVQGAVGRLGLSQVRQIVTGMALADAFGVGKGGAGMGLTDLYLQALAGGYATDVVLRYAKSVKGGRRGWFGGGGGKTNQYFTAALLRDVGLFVLQRFVPEMMEDCLLMARSQSCPLVAVEEELLGYGHTEVGAALLSRWRLSDLEIAVCKWHHDPDLADEEWQTPVQVVHVADTLTREALWQPELDLLSPQTSLNALEDLGIPWSALPDMIADAGEASERAREMLGVVAGDGGEAGADGVSA